MAEDWVRGAQSPRGVPAQLPTTALAPNTSRTQSRHGNPQRKTQPPSVMDTKGDERGFWLGKAGEEQRNLHQPAEQASQLPAQLSHGQDTRLWAGTCGFGVFRSQLPGVLHT